MRDENYLFVYGTLLKGTNHPVHRVLARHAQFVGCGNFQGNLYDLGSYPGAVASDENPDRVRGEVYRLRKPERVLRELDGYEGGEFRRERASIFLENGKEVRSWIYLYRGPMTGLKTIARGDYAKFLRLH